MTARTGQPECNTGVSIAVLVSVTLAELEIFFGLILAGINNAGGWGEEFFSDVIDTGEAIYVKLQQRHILVSLTPVKHQNNRIFLRIIEKNQNCL
jgi:hypothetical protein